MERITNIRAKYSLGSSGICEILCDIQLADGSIQQGVTRVVSDNYLEEWLKKNIANKGGVQKSA